MDCGTGVGTTSNKRARVPDVASAAASSSSSTDEATCIELPATAVSSLDEPDEQGMFDEIAQPCEQCGLPMFAGQCFMVNAETGMAQAVHAVWCPDCQYGTVMTPETEQPGLDVEGGGGTARLQSEGY